MLQIKKLGHSLKVTYNLQLLFRLKSLNNKYLLKKKTSSNIILRSPKHFNIGKQKIKNINYTFINIIFNIDKPINSRFLIHKTSYLFKLLDRYTQANNYLKTRSLKLSLKTKFTIMWLEF